MSFFSDEEIDSLKITRMILHVVGTKDFAAMPSEGNLDRSISVSELG